MRTLPYDFTRCKPNYPAEICNRCKRFADAPWQTWGMRTPITKFEPQTCGENFIPVEDEK